MNKTKPRSSFEPASESLHSFFTTPSRFGLAALCVALSSACVAGPSSRARLTGDGNQGAAGAGPSVGGPSDVGVGGSLGSGPMLNLGGDLSGGGSGGMSKSDVPETCDGLDNDQNGIIDDVDVGRDGVCDCLNVATIGQIGPWSDGGNIFVNWLSERSPQGAVALDDQVLTPELLGRFQVIVSLHVGTMSLEFEGQTTPAHHAFSQAESAAFKSWVEAGGGAMTTIGYADDEASEVTNVNLLLNPVGLGYSSQRLELTGYVQTWEAHPITAGVSNILTADGVEPESSGTTLAFGPGDAVALQVAEVANGRVVVWGDEWITYDSEWQDIEDQQVELFWLNILKWLSPPNECQVAIPPTVQ